MTAQIIDGKAISAQIRRQIADEIAVSGAKVKLAVVSAGENAASQVYIRNKKNAAEQVGIACDVYQFGDDVSETELSNLILRLNNDSEVNGIIVQLPLPAHLSENKITSLIAADKDVDAFGPSAVAHLWLGSQEWASATPQGVVYMLHTLFSDLSGKHAVIIGRSNIVGKPLAALLLQENCTVTLTHSKTVNIKAICKTADILIAACGCPLLVKKDWIKPGAVIIDVGISRVDGKLLGDVDFADVTDSAAYVSPVPGGVGPMTVAMLLKNTYSAYLKQKFSLK